MRNYHLALLAICFLILSGLACDTLLPAPTLIPAESPSPEECDAGRATVSVSAEANATTVTLSPGDTLAITLGSNATTGFEWTVLTINTDLVRYDGKAYTGSLIPAVGSGGAESLCFTALAPGTSRLAVIYHRPFETGIAPIETFPLTLEIK